MAPRGGNTPRQGDINSGRSLKLQDQPVQVGHRGVPILIPAPATPRQQERTARTTPAPSDDCDTFPALPPAVTSSQHDPKNDSEIFSISSKMADTGGGHVPTSTPPETHRIGKIDSGKFGENIKEGRLADSCGQVDRDLKEQSETLRELGSVVERAGLNNFARPPPAPKRTRESHRLDALHAPTKTYPSDAVLATRGRAATSQTQQLLNATARGQINPLQSAAQGSSSQFAGNPTQDPTPQTAPRSGPQVLGLSPQSQRRVPPPQYQHLSHQSLRSPYSSSVAPSLGSPFKSSQFQQNAKMGSGFSGASDLLDSSRGNRQSMVPTSAEETGGSMRQSNDPAQDIENKHPQSSASSSFRGLKEQTHATAAGLPAHSFGANQPGHNALQSQRSNMQQFPGFGQHQTSFAHHPEEARSAVDSALGLQIWDQTEPQKPSYTKSPSEHSFQQMPGAFDPRWSRSSFDALPPPSIASDQQNTAFSHYHRIDEQQMLPSFEISKGLSFGKQSGIVPSLKAVMEPVSKRQNEQEPQAHEPQSTGRNNGEPRELAAQAQGFSQQAPSFDVSKEPLMRPPPGLDQNATSFSVSEAQNDNQNIRPPPGFQPRRQELPASPTQAEVGAQQPISRLRAPVFQSHITSPNQVPSLATQQKLSTSEPAKRSAKDILKPSAAGDSRISEHPLLGILARRHGVSSPLAQSTSQQALRASEQKKTESSQLQQEMGSLIAQSTQQDVVAESSRSGFSMEDLETFEQLGPNQEPAHLVKKFRSLIPSDSESDSGSGSESDSDNDKSTQRGGVPTRAISPPRIVGGIHHASRHSSSRRSGDGGRNRSQSSTGRRQAPLQHTQPRVQLPLLPAPPGIVYMPSPYTAARPARAGAETSTEQLNRLLMIAHQDGYMPKHLTLFNDTSHAGFEKAFPMFKLVPRASMRYRMSYEGWERINRTHVPPRLIPAALKNWITMPGSGVWIETVDPRNIMQATADETTEGQNPLMAATAADMTKNVESVETRVEQQAVLKPTPQHNLKGKEPIIDVSVDEENNDTSIDDYAVDDQAEKAMMQQAIELSRRESTARIPVLIVAGPAPQESSRQSKLSAEATPFMAPAAENVVPALARRRGSRGRRGSHITKHSRTSSQASTPSRADSVPATPASRKNSSSSTPARLALAQTQQSQARIPAAQQARKVSGDAKPVAPVAKGNVMAYIPNISTHINPIAITNVLGRFGGVVNLEIDRRKGWGFIEFLSPAGFKAAVAANPHRIGKEVIRVQERSDKQPAVTPATSRQQAAKTTEKPAEISSLTGSAAVPKPVGKAAETSQVKTEPKIAWPNAPKPAVRPLQAAVTETIEVSKPDPLSLAKPATKATLKPVVKAAPKVPRTPKSRSPEQSTSEEEVKPSLLLEPPKTPPKFRQFIIPATPPTPGTQALLGIHTTGTQDKTFLALPEVEEVFENPPIIKKSAKTSKRAVEKAAKKAKALLAKEARAEVAGARLGMGKAVLEQIGALPDIETDVTITDEETGKKIKKPPAPKKVVVKGIEIIPGVEINENHSKDVYVDRSMLKDKFVISRGQLKEVDLEKKARKELEVQATQLAHKVRATEMKSRGKALASLSAEDWEEEEDRMAAAEAESARHSRRGSSTGQTGGTAVLMPLGADFSQWKPATPTPRPAPLVIDNRPDPGERPNTAMSMRSNMSGGSSSFPAPFPSATLPGPKDPSLFVEPEVIPPPLNRHLVPAPSMSEIIATEAAMRGGKLEKQVEPSKPAVPSSWAQLAAGKSSASTSADTSRRGSSEIIQLRSRSVSGAGNKNFMSRFNKAPSGIKSITYDTNPENKRSVYILGISQNTNLTDISDSVSSGAFGQIYKIEFAIDADTGLRLAGVLFRDAGGVVEGLHGKGWGAIGYHHALKNAQDADYLRESPLWPWPVDAPISVYLGDYPEEDLMLRMHHDGERAAAKKGGPACVTRRLCLVNGVQLHRDWHEEEMIAFCYASGVKQGNVQKCCVHNFGNATIVFGSVEDAVLARGKLLDKFKESAHMNVTFSSDPGESPGPVVYKRDNAYLKLLEQMTGLDVQQEIEEGHYREKKRRNSKWSAY